MARRGHVRRRGKGWVYVIRHPSLAKVEWSRQQPTADDAERLMTARLAELDKGLGARLSRDTVAAYLDAWLDGRTDVSRSTLAHYRWVVKGMIAPYLGKMKLQKIAPEDIAIWHAALIRKGYQPATIRDAHRILSAGLRRAFKWGHLPSNPAALVSPPALERTERQWWTAAEAQAFLDATEEHPDGTLYRLALATGMRRGELAALCWEDIDWKRSRVVVQRSITRGDGQYWTSGPPKTKRSRVVVVGASTMAALRRHQERQAFVSRGSKLVFPNRDGGVQSLEPITRRFNRAVRDAELPAIRFHDLRHTAATLMLEGMVPLKVVSERLGHTKVSTTSDLYQHVGETMQEQAADVMERLLGGS